MNVCAFALKQSKNVTKFRTLGIGTNETGDNERVHVYHSSLHMLRGNIMLITL